MATVFQERLAGLTRARIDEEESKTEEEFPRPFKRPNRESFEKKEEEETEVFKPKKPLSAYIYFS